MAKGEKGRRVPVDAVVHKRAKRTNIPTAELGSFIARDEAAPKRVLYPRDPSLDPQLVWKGKDEQDSRPLEVPAVPIYIQEKISPQALIANLKSEQRRNDDQPELFAEFNGLEFDKLVDFYKHSQSWTNRLILGDSLLVMTSLAEKEGLKGKVQMIYIDPPYGIQFKSNWQVSTRSRDVKDGNAHDLSRQPEQIHAFRDTWTLRIHSYLAYMRDRLVACRELLAPSGSVFVQIGDENVHLVRSLMDEVFGAENFVSLISFRKTGGTTGKALPGTADYILWFGKTDALKYRQLYRLREVDSSDYDLVELADGTRRRISPNDRDADSGELRGRRLQLTILTSPRIREGRTGFFPIEFGGKTYLPTAGEWKTNRAGIGRLLAANRIDRVGETLRYVRYADDFPASPLTNVWADVGGASDPVYVVQTNTKIVERCLLMCTDPGELVLDPTCGSGTTAFVAEQWGRRWITADTSRVALALTRTRLMAGRYPYYVLADSAEADVSKGFIYDQLPHVTLKSIANNPDIKDGMSREEVSAAIRRHTEHETLFDKPHVDSRIVRVSGPFSVESLSPHRIVDPTRQRSTAGAEGPDGRFEQVILENLKAAGVQNTVKNERLTFDSLEPWSGVYVNAVGEYTENGRVKRAAISIGPEHGTVGLELVREAAKEAAKFFDILIICGFAFEARVGEEASHLGRLTILRAAMNPDLAMDGDLLKKTGSANLFVVFGEPDIEIRRLPEDKIQVEIRGLDVYDPTTGEIRSHSTADIACWFVDTDYNEESFFVRHAYFLGAGDPYEQLKRALHAEIDEGVWSSLYSTVSRPFALPKTGRIAVKVINHYGDEVMKVYGLD